MDAQAEQVFKVIVTGSSCLNHRRIIPDSRLDEGEKQVLKNIRKLDPDLADQVEALGLKNVFSKTVAMTTDKSDSKAQYAPGGGCINIGRNIIEMAKHYGLNVEVNAFTEIGPETLSNGEDNEESNEVREYARELGITLHDLVPPGEDYTVPINTILETRNGRPLEREPKEPTSLWDNDKPFENNPELGETIDELGSETDFTVVQASKFTPIAARIAQAVHQNGGHVTNDFDIGCPVVFSQHGETLLCNSDAILAPLEAFHPRDGESLLDRISQNEFNYPYTLAAVTSGIDDAHVNSGYTDWTMPIPLKELPPKGNSGAGDAQKAGFVIAKMRGFDDDRAMHFASAISSFSVAYEGSDWLNHLDEFDKLYEKLEFKKYPFVPSSKGAPVPANTDVSSEDETFELAG